MGRLRDDYFADGRPRTAEAGRLQRLDRFYAEPTQTWLSDAVRFRPGFRVLEIGAGSGGMLSWFAEHVGPTGDVLGLDRTLAHIGPTAPPVRLLEADLYALPTEPERFDLVYARLVLEHLPDPDQALRAMMSWLRPGGVMAVADLDCSACRPVDRDATGMAAFDADLHAIRDGLKASALMDPDFGTRLTALMATAGLEAPTERRFDRVVQGGSDWALFQAENNLMVGELIGDRTTAERVAAVMRDPASQYHDQALVCVTGRKPV